MKPRRLLALLLAALVLVPGSAMADEDPNLDQQVESTDPVVTDNAVLDHGHIDLGPKFVDGQWTFLLHDDLAKADASAQSVWRYPENTVIDVPDAAMLPVPDDPEYEFLGMPGSSDAWVVPQTQDPAIPWLGWNTQDPEVMERIDRGITLRLEGVQGPGHLVAYLQSGSFEAPDVLWDSRKNEPQDLWVDVNTHTHANWVFSKPGVYLVRVTAAAELVDGTQVSDTQDIRLAVGDVATVDEAFAATWAGGDPEAATNQRDEQPVEGEASDSDSDPVVVWLIAAIGLVAVLLVAGLIISIVRIRAAKRRALAGHGTGESEPEQSGVDQ